MVDIEYFKRRQQLIELRYNPYHDPSTGRFCSGGSGNSGLTKAEKSATMITVQKMSAYKNDWSRATPQSHSPEEIQQIIDYAAAKGIKIYNPKSFDGDTEMLKSHIDNIANLKEQFNIKKKITISFQSMDDDDFAITQNSTITFNKKTLWNKSVTNANLRADKFLAANDYIGISSHEMGHVIANTYGEKGLDIAKQAYIRTFGKSISTDGVLAYLKDNVSTYSVTTNPMSKKVVHKEIIPEVLSKHISGNQDIFTDEFMLLLKRVVK